MDNEAQAGALVKEAVNLVTQGMSQQKKTEEKAGRAAGKAVSNSAPVKDAKEKLEHAATDKAKNIARSAADKLEQAAQDYSIKFRKKEAPAKNTPGRGEGDTDYWSMQKEADKTRMKEDTKPNLHHDMGIIGQKQKAQQAPLQGLTGQALNKTAGNTAHKAVETGKETAQKIQKAAGTAAKGAEVAGKTAATVTAPVSAPVMAGAKLAAAGAKAAAKGAKTIVGAGGPVGLRAVGTKAMENLIRNNGQGNKEAPPVISAKDVGKEVAKNALVNR